jgi:hypothetical protein
VLLISIGGLRVFLAAALGPLRRRRTFEPDRVREAPRPSLTSVYLLGVVGAAVLVASFVPAWLRFLDGNKHVGPSVSSYVLWVAVAMLGFAVVAIAYLRNKDSALRASALAWAWLTSVGHAGSRSFARFIFAPATEIAVRFGDRWIPAGDAAVGSAVEAGGRYAVAAARLPVLPIVIALAVVLTLVVALASPGVFI